LDFEFELVGVNHLPIVTQMRVAGDDGFERLRALLDEHQVQHEQQVQVDRGKAHGR